MQTDELRSVLEDPQSAALWLGELGVEDLQRARGNLVRMVDDGLTYDLLAVVCEQLQQRLPQLSDPDMALNNLQRFVAASRSPLALGSLFERDPDSLPILLQIFSTSQHLSDLLVADPQSYDLLRMTDGIPVQRSDLIDELDAELAPVADARVVMAALRRFKRRETLRIAYGDIVRGQSLPVVTSQISFLADAIVECALRSARRRLAAKTGGTPGWARSSRFVVLALGKLGGLELNYSSDIDLIFLYDAGRSAGEEAQHQIVQWYTTLARELVRLLTESTEHGTAYRVDLRLRPQGSQGPIVVSLDGARHYYDVHGRTWERQAMVKARPIAGDSELGEELLGGLQPWVYRRYLSRADISGIKALKRRIEQRARREGTNDRDVKTGEGGIRDIEFVIQFLQLLGGGELPQVRTGNTLQAIAALENANYLSRTEQSILEENYCFLRRIEHLLQIMFDLQTHLLPVDEQELQKLAVRLGYRGTSHQTAREAFAADYETKTGLNRKILNHLLHDAFGKGESADPEVDLVLDPEPSKAFIDEVLSRYRFADPARAYKNLMTLATERIAFLSTRRCRHFLASIAPPLLAAISATPDPDSTLVTLSKVSDSLGGKGVLWELFSFSAPSMHLVVELCSCSPLLSEILIGNPGMIDELMDSLLLNRLPDESWLDRAISDLCRGAEDVEPILHSFKNAQQLRVGVRDILGKDDIQATNAALADIAAACLRQIAERQTKRLIEKFGRPVQGSGPHEGEPCELIIVGMGKFGGREPNYHSDLDLIFLYEAEGTTFAERPSQSARTTSNQHFFGELGQRIVKFANRLGPYGRLYEVDPRLRPTGRSGALATSLAELADYFARGDGQLWERLALCKARPVFGSIDAAARAMDVIHRAAYGPPWREEDAAEVYRMRMRLEETASRRNLKRGPGGIVDVEFLVQMLQLSHQGNPAPIRVPGTLEALAALHDAGYLETGDFEFFSESYRFLRNVEARLRLMNTTLRHDLPEDPADLVKLARLLGYPSSTNLLDDCRDKTTEVRRRFLTFFPKT